MELAKNQGYLSLSARDLLAEHPTWTIRKVVVDGIVIKEGLAPQKLECENLSSHPELEKQPMSVKLAARGADQPTLSLGFNFAEAGKMHDLVANLQNLALGNDVKLSKKASVDIQGGRVTVEADGGFSRDSLDIQFAVAVDDLKAKTQEGKSLFGLDAETSKQVFEHLKELKLSGKIEGALTSPRLKLDTKNILANLKEALIEAGKAELARRANEQLDRLRGEVSEKVDEALKDALPEGVGGEAAEKIGEAIKDKLPEGLKGGLDKLLPGGGAKDGDAKDDAKDDAKKEGDPKDEGKKKIDPTKILDLF